MRKILSVIFFISLVTFGHAQVSQDTSLVEGKVSHQFKKSGCRTVVILQSDPSLILIPRENLPKYFDKNGLHIIFRYRRLRIPNPVGCVKGVPAELAAISRKK